MNCFTVVKILVVVLLLIIAPAGCKRGAAPAASGTSGTQTTPMASEASGGTQGTPDAAADITAGVWRLAAIQRPGGGAETAVAPDPPYTVQFNADNRISGQAHCNRHMGKYELRPGGGITITAGASTLMMCLGESIADEFLKMLAATASYETRGGKLILSSGDGAKLTFDRRD